MATLTVDFVKHSGQTPAGDTQSHLTADRVERSLWTRVTSLLQWAKDFLCSDFTALDYLLTFYLLCFFLAGGTHVYSVLYEGIKH